MNAAYALQIALNATAVSALYGLLAVAYVLVHGITRRVNLAFGALSVWASYLVINLTLYLMLTQPGEVLLPLLLAGLYAVVGTATLGIVIERTVVRPLVGGGALAMLTATLGLAIALDETMRLMNNSSERWLMPMFDDPVAIGTGGGVQTTVIQLFVCIVALALSVLVVVGMERLRFGRVWRAVSQDGPMAELCGIDTGRVLAATFVLASASAAAAGTLSAVYYGQASFYSSLVVGLKTMFVAVVGGLDSVGGAFVAALLLGAFETAWSGYFSEEWRDVISLLLLTGLMIFFPAGLFVSANRRDDLR